MTTQNLAAKAKRILGFALFGMLVIFYQNCSQNSALQLTHANSASPGGDADGDGSGSAGGNTQGGSSGSGTAVTIQQIQPALAVRGAGCLMCHANIQSNMISDFGYGDSFFVDMDESGGLGTRGNGISQIYYNPIPWQATESLSGQVIVPVAAIPAAVVSGAGLVSSSMSLLSFLTDSTIKNYASSYFSYFNYSTTPADVAPLYAVAPPTGQPAAVADSTVYIGAPTLAEIQALAPGRSTGAVVVSSTGSVSPAAGFSIANGTTGPYVSNSGSVQCAGSDIVITGTLLLKNLQVYAGSDGCRLYVTGAVFIEGPITYLNSGSSVDPTQNLQITSAEAVIMGVGLSGSSYLSGANMSNPEAGSNPLQTRLIGDVRDIKLRAYPNTTEYMTWAQGVYEEGANIGSTNLVDASDIAGAALTAVSSAGQTRVAINYEHLLINAPIVHSRYLGSFTGVVIAEIGEFSLGQFVFNYDTVFNMGVPILPLISKNYDILCATNSAGCRPATAP